MKLAKALAYGLLLGSVLNANAVETKFVPGDYTTMAPFYYGQAMETGRFQIRQQGAKVRFIDTQRQIVYNLNLSNPGVQNLPKKYIDFLKTNRLLGTFGQIIEKITVSEISQGSGPQEFTGNINLHLLLKSFLGEARLVLQMKGVVESRTAEGTRYNNQGMPSPFTVNNIHYTVSDLRVAHFDSYLPDDADNFVASILTDLTLRLSSMGPLVEEDLYETK